VVEEGAPVRSMGRGSARTRSSELLGRANGILLSSFPFNRGRPGCNCNGTPAYGYDRGAQRPALSKLAGLRRKDLVWALLVAFTHLHRGAGIALESLRAPHSGIRPDCGCHAGFLLPVGKSRPAMEASICPLRMHLVGQRLLHVFGQN